MIYIHISYGTCDVGDANEARAGIAMDGINAWVMIDRISETGRRLVSLAHNIAIMSCFYEVGDSCCLSQTGIRPVP